MRRVIRSRWLGGWLVAAAAACAVAGLAPLGAAAQSRFEGMVDPPILRSFYWFRYVAGRDIRDECRPGTPLRLRAVYNAQFNDQVRSYDAEQIAGSGLRLTSRVYVDIGSVSSVSISQIDDLTAPWRPKKSERLLNAPETARLMQALADSGGFGPPPKGRELPSNDYWWTVASCRDGRWGFQAYHHPSDGFARVRFAELLFAADGTGVPVAQPRKLPPAEFRGERTRNWRLAVGADGLRDY